MRVLVKLGGSLITDKLQEAVYRPEVVRQIAAEIRTALTQQPDLQIIIGHGSGSFGHVEAKRNGTINGVHSPEQWRGFARVANVAAELNYLVVKTLQEEGLPVLRIQPSAALLAHDGAVKSWELAPVRNAIDSGLIPVIHGDVAPDEVRGGTILSTETLFFYLARQIHVDAVFLLGEVEGVYDAAGVVIPNITPLNLAVVESALGGSHGTDVTGGMETKVRDMVALVQMMPHLAICIFGGKKSGLLASALLNVTSPGTLISAAR
jgi:isopentenyl phosphate kinase